MSTLTERTRIDAIAYSAASDNITVTRATEVLRGEDVIHTVPSSQHVKPEDDLAALEPEVQAVAAAVWKPETVHAAREALLEAERGAIQKKIDECQRLHDRLTEMERSAAERLAAVERSHQAVASAHAELDAEHATLAQRQEAVTTARADLFRRHEQIRAQHPKLDGILKEMADAIPAPRPLTTGRETQDASTVAP